MPDAKNSLALEASNQNAFVSPFSDQLPSNLYSSITIAGQKKSGGCISCAVLNLNQLEIQNFINDLSTSTSLENFQSAADSKTEYSNTLPLPLPQDPNTPSQPTPPTPPNPSFPINPTAPASPATHSNLPFQSGKN